jgi:EamA domain-containing membrane protein RarD
VEVVGLHVFGTGGRVERDEGPGAHVEHRLFLLEHAPVVFPSFLAYLLSIWALHRTASSLVAMYVYLQPLVTALTAPLVLGEQVTAGAGVAAALIFSGLALATWGEQATGRALGDAYRPPAEGA